MKRIFLCLLALSSGAFSQAPSDLNEGSTLISLGNNSYRFTWWARAGVFYLVVSRFLTPLKPSASGYGPPRIQ